MPERCTWAMSVGMGLFLVCVLAASSARAFSVDGYTFGDFTKSGGSCYQCGGGGRGDSESASPQEIIRWKSWKLNGQGIELERAGRLTAALEMFRQAMNTDQTNMVVASNFYALKARMEFKDDVDLALLDAQRAVDFVPPTARSEWRSSMFDWLRRFKVQAEIFKRGRATAATQNQAYSLMQQGDYAHAVTILSEVAQQNPNNVSVYNQLSQAYYVLASDYEKKKRWDDEVEAFKHWADAYGRLRQIDPRYSSAQVMYLDHIIDALTYGGPLKNYDFQHDPRAMSDDRLKFQLSILRQIQQLNPNAHVLMDGEAVADVIDFYSKLEAKVASASDQLQDAEHNSRVALEEPRTSVISSDLNGPDEIARGESNCGFDGMQRGCQTANHRIEPFKKNVVDPPAVAALKRAIPDDAKNFENYSQIRQMVDWYSHREGQREQMQAQLAAVEQQNNNGTGDQTILAAQKEILKNNLRLINKDETTTKANIEQALKDDGLIWNEETQSSSVGQPLSKEESDDLGRRFGK